MRRDPVLLVLVGAFVLVGAVWGARSVVHLDAVPLQLALAHQDLRLHQPQPPGYVLHLWLAEVVQALSTRPVFGLRTASLALLVGAALFLYRLALLWFDRAAARFAVLLFVTSPLVLFHGMTAGPYAGEAFAGTSTAFFLLRAWRSQHRDLRFVFYWLGLMGGLRPTTLLGTLPLAVWVARQLGISRRNWLLAGLAGTLGTLCWLMPQAMIAGGLDDYFPLVWQAAVPAWRAGAALGGPFALAHQVALVAGTVFFGIGCGRWLGMLAARAKSRSTGGAAAVPRGLFAAWLLPPVLYALLFGMTSSGYGLAFAAPLCLWLAVTVRQSLSRPEIWRSSVGAVLVFDLALFFFVPTPATRPESGGWSRLLSRTDFFFDRTRMADFAPLRATLLDLGPLAPMTLVVGGTMTRAATIVAPACHVLHFDALRPAPFLHYQEERPTIVPDPYVVPQEISWLLVEGSRAQIVGTGVIGTAPGTGATPAGSGDFQLLALGDGPLDLWFVPTGAEELRAHLVRGAPPRDPKVFERTQAPWKQNQSRSVTLPCAIDPLGVSIR